MRIDGLEILNFRGIRKVLLDDLRSTVVIAGANGSGKSCIFDAIRLLKSAYGGYQANEWHHWMAEFQINFQNNAESFQKFFQDKSRRLSIRCVFRLDPHERQYLQEHGKELVKNSVWRLIAPEMYSWSNYRAAPMAAQYRNRESEVTDLTDKQWAEMQKELSEDTIIGQLWADAGSDLKFMPSKSLEILFSSFVPGELGLIDYHGAQRLYTRDNVAGINLDLSVQEQNSKNHALYNYSNKYSNVKTEMAGSFVKELLAEKAGKAGSGRIALDQTLKELFSTFFPDKEFLGIEPTPEGSLNFPVRTASGAIHDLDELSAGEKEVLYGYLRMRNSAPRYSVILMDEPELHLNPRLIQGLPRFYHEHLGVALDNQIWLVTHSDTLLREVVGRSEYSVFHMIGVTPDENDAQIMKLTLAEDAERAIISLVGDIAAYRPGKKIVIFEGGGGSELDVYMTTQLFPEFSTQVNVISSGNKLRVRELHSVLDEAQKKGMVPFKTFSITDRDSEDLTDVVSPRFKWNVYHIENYLLEADYILRVLTDLNLAKNMSDGRIYDLLRSAAQETLHELVRHELVEFANRSIVSAINLGSDPSRKDIAVAISEAIGRSATRVGTVISENLKTATLLERESELRMSFQKDLAGDSWRSAFRGRDILRKFVSANCNVSYETFRDLLIARMKDAGFRPVGMKLVIDEILTA